MDPELWQEEIEPCEESYYEEENQRVGESEQEASDEVAPVIGRPFVLSLQCTCGVFLQKIAAECSDYETADNLDCELMRIKKVCDKTEAEPSEKAVNKVAERRPQSGKKTGPAPFAEGALYDEHSYRTHGCRYEQADRYAAW